MILSALSLGSNIESNLIHTQYFEGTPTNLQEKIRYIERSIFVLVIEELKEFADGNFEGKKPEWIVSSTNPIPNTDNDVQTKDYFAYY